VTKRRIAELIAEIERERPPEDFTARVMFRVEAVQPVPGFVGLIRSLETRVAGFALRRPVTRSESSFYFFLVGFFYFIVGVTVLAGLRAFPPITSLSGWIALQPYASFTIALLFLILGVILRTEKRHVFPILTAGICGYIAMIVLNGILLQLLLGTTSTLFFTAGLILAGGFMGLLLIIAVENTEGETV
jgi:hypothetical protein